MSTEMSTKVQTFEHVINFTSTVKLRY